MVYQVSKILPYPKELLYKIVADVNSYPDFLPWLKAANLYHKTAEYFEADLIISFGPLEKQYRSEVFLTENSIRTNAKPDGLFKHLNSLWTFKTISEHQTEIEFTIDFALSSQILQLTAGKFLEEATKTMIKAFEERAATLTV